MEFRRLLAAEQIPNMPLTLLIQPPLGGTVKSTARECRGNLKPFEYVAQRSRLNWTFESAFFMLPERGKMQIGLYEQLEL